MPWLTSTRKWQQRMARKQSINTQYSSQIYLEGLGGSSTALQEFPVNPTLKGNVYLQCRDLSLTPAVCKIMSGALALSQLCVSMPYLVQVLSRLSVQCFR